jgi:predicted ferric reductase
LGGVALLLVLGAVASRLGLLSLPLPRPDGTAPWLAARASGLVAFLALTLDTVLGLMLSTALADRVIARGHAVEIHRWLTTVTLVLVGVHALSLCADAFVRFDALDVIVPFLAPYRRIAVGLGVLAAELALLVWASFLLRKRLGARTWRRLHYLTFALFALAALHGVFAGSDAEKPWARALMLGSTGLVGLLVVVRVAAPLVKRLRQRTRSAGAH